MYTVTVYSKPLGGIAGCTRVFPDVLQAVDKIFRKAKGNILHDFVVTHIGDRVVSIIVSDGDVKEIIKEAYAVGEEIAEKRKLFKNKAEDSSISLTF
ncbi:MAG TPA: fructose 1,6-bisphosphatase, partial [Methanocorpusculum sp.]|nr:fructose 1,6-bisphosphatase [Methanocorpusculum sp.]